MSVARICRVHDCWLLYNAAGDRFVRLVFSNEPVARLRGLGERVRRSLEG